MPRTRVAITGLGCISPLGRGIAGTADSLRSARDCVTPVRAFDVSQCKCRTAGQADIPAVIDGLPRSRFWNPASRMLLAAMEESGAARFKPDTVIIGTTSGGMTFGEDFYRMFAGGSRRARAAHWVREYMPQQPVRDALDALGIDTPVRITSNACASGSNAIGMAFHTVRSGRSARALCGGYDILCQLVFAGFSSLQAATGELCRPFDRGRTGLVLGEAAAVLLLESFESARASGRPILAEVTGYGASNDNHHLTQPNPDGSGPRRAMEAALRDAGRDGSEIDYVNAHGTATAFNDACEARAISDACPQAAVSSSKGQMGHSLGAAGAIEAAFCILAMNEGFLPANLHFREPDEGVALDIVANEIREFPPKRILSNSLGFGGANASLLFEAP